MKFCQARFGYADEAATVEMGGRDVGYTDRMVTETAIRGMCVYWCRVARLSGTQVYAPRYYRRFPGLRRLTAAKAGTRCRHNLLGVQTLIYRRSEIVLVAACHDFKAEDAGQHRLR